MVYCGFEHYRIFDYCALFPVPIILCRTSVIFSECFTMLSHFLPKILSDSAALINAFLPTVYSSISTLPRCLAVSYFQGDFWGLFFLTATFHVILISLTGPK